MLSVVGLSAMRDSYDLDDQRSRLDVIDDSIWTYSNAIAVFRAGELSCSRRKRFIRQSFHSAHNAQDYFLRELSEFFAAERFH